MNPKGIVSGIVALILVIVGMFYYTALKKNDIQKERELALPVADVQSPYDYITRIDAKHFIADSMHTIVGELLLPTPCDLLEIKPKVNSEQGAVLFEFSIINTTATCAQVMTVQKFQSSVSITGTPTFSATVNGRKVDLNLIPARSGESPQSFELLNKG